MCFLGIALQCFSADAISFLCKAISPSVSCAAYKVESSFNALLRVSYATPYLSAYIVNNLN